MPKTTLAISIIAILFATKIFAQEPGMERSAVPGQITWQFTEEQLRLFSPPMEATIEEMRGWHRQLERANPDNPEKWGGIAEYWEQVGQLRFDIARQIIASKPDDKTLHSEYVAQWYAIIGRPPDRIDVSQLENFYVDLKRQNDERGRKLDWLTHRLMEARLATAVRLVTRHDTKYLSLVEELLAEFDTLLTERPLGKDAEPFYGSKFALLSLMTIHGEQFIAASSTFKDEMQEILDTRENELETAVFYRAFYPLESTETPEGQAKHRKWIERLVGRIAVTEDIQKRYGLHGVKGQSIERLLENNAATEEEYRAYAQELETKYREQEHVDVLIHAAYRFLFEREFARLFESDTITDEALRHFFASAHHLLHAGKFPSFHNGRTLSVRFFYFGNGLDALFARLTPEQKTLYIEAFAELHEEVEKIEEKWLASDESHPFPSDLPLWRNHLGQIQLPGKEVAFTGTTLDGKPFDIESLRGKIVLLDFWSTTCAPCIAKMPELKELHEKYHAHGFEVVGILVDVDRNLERAAEIIGSRELPWIQLHDPQDELYRQFHGHGVPHCILLDRDGRVILLDARGEALTRKLAELF